MTGLAYVNGEGPVELATQVDVRDGPPVGERGSADDMNPMGLMYGSYDNGKVLDAPDPHDDDFERMFRADGKARAVEQVLTLPLRWARMQIVPQDGDQGEAEFVREALERPANAGGMTTPFYLVLAQMTSAATYRRAFFEKVFGVNDEGRVVYDKLAFRPARTCTLLRDARTRSFAGFRQKVRDGKGVTSDVDFKPEKAFVYLHGQHRDPLRGSSEMETVWSCFESKQKVRFLWFSFLETQVLPYGVLSTDGDRAARVREVAKLKQGGLVGLGLDESLDSFGGDSGAGSVFKDAMDWLSAEMSGSVLASFTDLAQQGSGRGSYALSKDQTDFFVRSRQATLQEMGTALTGFAVADLVRWNFGPDGRAPAAVLRLEEGDAEEAANVFRLFAQQAQPNPQIPHEFVDLLTEKVAEMLGLDVDKVSKAIEARMGQAGDPAEALREGIGAAAQAVAEAGVVPGNGAGPATGNAEPSGIVPGR